MGKAARHYQSLDKWNWCINADPLFDGFYGGGKSETICLLHEDMNIIQLLTGKSCDQKCKLAGYGSKTDF